MKILVSCSKISLLVFYMFLLLIIICLSFSYCFDKQEIILDNEESRQKFLSSCGFSNLSEPEDCVQIIIPLDFSTAFSDYNKALNAGGWDLSYFAGKELTQYSYKTDNGVIHLILHDGVLVCGDICESVENGQIRPLIPND